MHYETTLESVVNGHLLHGAAALIERSVEVNGITRQHAWLTNVKQLST